MKDNALSFKTLLSMRIEQGLSVKAIATILQLPKSNVSYWLNKYDIKKKPSPYQQRDWLFDQYIIKEKTAYEIAEAVNVDNNTIYKYLKEFNIPIRSIGIDRLKNKTAMQFLTKDWLQEQYITNELSSTEISKILEVAPSTVCKYLTKFNIPIRTIETRNKKVLYGKENPSFGIPLSEETRVKISQNRKGKGIGVDSGNWKGGITKLYDLLRKSSFYSSWRDEVFKRDNFCCCWCGDNTGKNLNADHIKPFALILQINNVQTLEDGYKCDELWDLDNGRTLCEKCHKNTETYGYKTILLLKNNKNSTFGKENE